MSAPKWTSDPDVVEYLPRFDKQIQVQFAPANETTLFIGGVGFGKTLSLADFLIEECGNYPNNQVMCAGSTKPSMDLATIEKVIDEIKARNVWIDFKDYLGEVYFANGSWFKFQSLDVSKQELEGSELGALAIDEISGCPKDKVEALLNRVRRKSPIAERYQMAMEYGVDTEGLITPDHPEWWDYSRRKLLCGNPPPPGHWLEDMFIRTDGDTRPPVGKVIQASTYENRLLTKDYIQSLERVHVPGTFQHKRMMLGMFGIPAEGAIYDVFSTSCIVSPNDVPWDEGVAIIDGIDLGHGDPFVYMRGLMVDRIVNGRRPIYIFGEYYSTPKLLKDHKRAVEHSFAKVTGPGGKTLPLYRFCDYGGQERMEMEALGWKTIPANKDILMGIHAVRSRMANGQLFFVQGRTPNFMMELPFYQWKEGDKPYHEKGDHALDAVRYIVTGADIRRNKD